MTRKELFNWIHRFCESHADPKNVQKYSRYFKNGYNGYGLSQKDSKLGLEELMATGQITLPLVLDTAPLLLKTGQFEETSFALGLLKKFIPEFTLDTFTRLEKWFESGINNWAHADSIALDVFPAFIRNKIVPLKSFVPWRKSSNKFQRRVPAVIFIKLLKDSRSFQPYFKFIEPLMIDDAREVHQGVGWFLREAWKIRRAETEKFLMEWKEDGARLIFQYATEKMTPKEKDRFRRARRK